MTDKRIEEARRLFKEWKDEDNNFRGYLLFSCDYAVEKSSGNMVAFNGSDEKLSYMLASYVSKNAHLSRIVRGAIDMYMEALINKFGKDINIEDFFK